MLKGKAMGGHATASTTLCKMVEDLKALWLIADALSPAFACSHASESAGCAQGLATALKKETKSLLNSSKELSAKIQEHSNIVGYYLCTLLSPYLLDWPLTVICTLNEPLSYRYKWLSNTKLSQLCFSAISVKKRKLLKTKGEKKKTTRKDR